MSGGVPKKVWQGRMATKTNQTGMKIQGFPSMIGRKTSNKRIISNRVNSKFVVCGSGRSGWRCKHGVVVIPREKMLEKNIANKL